MASKFAYRTAKNLVGQCQSETDEIMAHHHLAIECRNCEDLLQLAIHAFEWTRRAEREFRENSIRESAESLTEGQQAMRYLRDTWIEFASAVLAWSQKQVQRGFDVDNLGQLGIYLAQMRDIVAEEDRMAEIAMRVPTSEELSLIAIDPQEWLDEPSWGVK